MSPPWTSATAEARNVSKSGCSSCMSGEGSRARSAGGCVSWSGDGHDEAREHRAARRRRAGPGSARGRRSASGRDRRRTRPSTVYRPGAVADGATYRAAHTQSPGRHPGRDLGAGPSSLGERGTAPLEQGAGQGPAGRGDALVLGTWKSSNSSTRCVRARSRSSPAVRPTVRNEAVERPGHVLTRGHLGVRGGDLGVDVVGRRVGAGDGRRVRRLGALEELHLRQRGLGASAWFGSLGEDLQTGCLAAAA